MKKLITPKVLAIVFTTGTLLSGCTKEVAKDQSQNVIASREESSVIVEQAAGVTTVTLRPGADGQDTWVSKIDNDANDGNTNLNYTNEILAAKFYYYGQLATQRGYIKFDSLLFKVPATAKIISARLYLYGESSSISFTNGNSYFESSGNPENSCLIQRVTGGNWDESTLTWNNKPATTVKGQDTIAASTSQWNYNTSVDVTSLVVPIIKLGKNYGFCMRMITEESYRILEFSTSEATSPSLRPKLVIRYK